MGMSWLDDSRRQLPLLNQPARSLPALQQCMLPAAQPLHPRHVPFPSYHYYLHGEHGNREPGINPCHEGRLPNGEPFPDITVQARGCAGKGCLLLLRCVALLSSFASRLVQGLPLFPPVAMQYQVNSRIVWMRRLAEVDDDMETKLLRTQKAELPFTLQVPDKVRIVVDEQQVSRQAGRVLIAWTLFLTLLASPPSTLLHAGPGLRLPLLFPF